MAGELFKIMAGVDMLHVPYRGAAPALTDLISGQVQVMILPITSSIEHIKAGRLRALGVTTATRLEVVPDIPTVAEFLPGYDVSDWTGIGVPRGTPAEIVDKLNTEISAALDDPKIKARFAELGSQLMPMSRADFGKLIADETAKWAKVVKSRASSPNSACFAEHDLCPKTGSHPGSSPGHAFRDHAPSIVRHPLPRPRPGLLLGRRLAFAE